MPVVFGSAGDIITVSLLVKDLVKALNDSCGSAVEYQNLIHDLQLLENLLLRVQDTLRATKTTVELAALCQTSERIASACAGSIERFRERVRKYDKTLANNDANKIKSAVSKMRWHVSEKDELPKFRIEIAGHLASLNLLLSAANT